MSLEPVGPTSLDKSWFLLQTRQLTIILLTQISEPASIVHLCQANMICSNHRKEL